MSIHLPIPIDSIKEDETKAHQRPRDIESTQTHSDAARGA